MYKPFLPYIYTYIEILNLIYIQWPYPTLITYYTERKAHILSPTYPFTRIYIIMEAGIHSIFPFQCFLNVLASLYIRCVDFNISRPIFVPIQILSSNIYHSVFTLFYLLCCLFLMRQLPMIIPSTYTRLMPAQTYRS